MRRLSLIALAAAAAAVALAACGGGEADPASSPAPGASQPTTTTEATTEADQASGKQDPREGGFEIALGEWALTAEAEAIRPGRTTFVITNRGTVPHGFELEREDVEDDSSKVETRFLDPGESVELELDLAAGLYKLECNVEGHDDMGMEMLLEVSDKAPLARAKQADAPAPASVSIEAFAFGPATLEVAAGQEVTWENHDPAEHTVTADGGGFDSGTMAQGATFKTTFEQPGEFRYICALHPGMKGTVVVTR
jgi:plastocyanin